jgi:hypothetical protein
LPFGHFAVNCAQLKIKINNMKKLVLTLSLVAGGIGLSGQTSTIWESHDSNLDTLWGIRYISAVDSNTVWGIGFDGKLTNPASNWFTRTSNGNNFTAGKFLPDTNDWNASGITAVNDSVAYIPCYFIAGTGRSGVVRKTTDKGVTWTTCTDTTTMFTGAANFPDWAHFWDNNHGIILGDPNGNTAGSGAAEFEIYITYNGGTNWTRVPDANIPNPNSGEYGVTNVYTTYGKKFMWYGTIHQANSTVNRVFRSSDTGHTWQASIVPGLQAGISGLAFRDSMNGFAWGFTSTTSGKYLLKVTHDGGVTWTTSYTHSNSGTYDISAVPGRNAFISVGADSTTQAAGAYNIGGFKTSVTTDDGLTWQVLESGPVNISDNVNARRMLVVRMLDSLHGWAGCFSDSSNLNGMDKYRGSKIPTSCPMFISGSASMCSGGTAVLTASGATSYNWNPGGMTTPSITVTPTQSTTYTMTGTTSTCTNSATFALTVNPTPTISISSSVSNDTICAGSTAQLTASGGTTYAWQPVGSFTGAGATVTTATSLTATTTFTVTGTTGSCSSQKTITIAVKSCVGINQLSVNGGQISFYPNPSSGIVNVTMQNIKAGTNITVTDLLGNEVYRTVVNSGNLNQTLNIDLSQLSKGVYLFGASSGSQSSVQKLVIQ